MMISIAYNDVFCALSVDNNRINQSFSPSINQSINQSVLFTGDIRSILFVGQGQCLINPT